MSESKPGFFQQHPKIIALMLSGVLLFVIMLLNLLFDGPMLRLDEWVSTHVPELQSEQLTEIVVFITNINGVVGSAILSFFILAFLFYKKYYVEFKFYLITFLGASALFTVLKLLIERVRPALKIIDEQGLSFPSGHSTMSTTIALSLYFIFISKVHSRFGRGLLLAFAIVWPLLIISTRLYLNVHWLSDTIAGYSLGIFWVTLCVWFFQREKTGKRFY